MAGKNKTKCIVLSFFLNIVLVGVIASTFLVFRVFVNDRGLLNLLQNFLFQQHHKGWMFFFAFLSPINNIVFLK